MTPSNPRIETRKALQLISNLATYHDIAISGFLRDKQNESIVGVVINFVPPIKEEDLEREQK